ncbi:YheV family putative metal-binding protein [Marinomonas agarivorans]|nr:YheV family putative metal-binding protein [Marinomonas agarivorans]
MKRFIAGAVCPRCSEMDKLRTWRDDEQEIQYRECVNCHYTDQQSTKVQMQPEELPTRVNQPHTQTLAGEETVIQFVPNTDFTKH